MNIKVQSMIVKQRLLYHFASTTKDKWNIPKNMPFMNEFLNEVLKLCNMCEENIINHDLLLDFATFVNQNELSEADDKITDYSIKAFLKK